MGGWGPEVGNSLDGMKSGGQRGLSLCTGNTQSSLEGRDAFGWGQLDMVCLGC